MERHIEPEWLDQLPPDDPMALGSRRDLARLNAWMGNARIMSRALRSSLDGTEPRRLIELGAGDGRFLLRVAGLLRGRWKGPTVVLLDRHNLLELKTRQSLETLGWKVTFLPMDVFEWLSQPSAPCDALLANLFLHHFSAAQLTRMFSEIAKWSSLFVAVEPRRSHQALLFSRLVGVIGCNRVTRHDAPVSVLAGFTGRELSQLWPAAAGWSLGERPAGWCAHLFVAQRKK